ncbi:MAG: class I SAM-dependent methyltransferase, partial [Bacteroidota bacterium]|nr:class I SAM-dependent methyltransferase [Bacteroidota bacterium]
MSFLNSIPLIGNIKTRILKLVHKSIYLPGHYCSPIPDLKEILVREDKLFDTSFLKIPGIDINDNGQKELLKIFKSYHSDFPFKNLKEDNLDNRYYFKNGFFNKSDAFLLYSILRKFQPKRVIEVGSGYSSAVILDTNNLFLENRIENTFIEPYPKRLRSLLKKEDVNHQIIEKKVQEVGIEVFKKLEKDDILFIDSSHISKIGSDLNYLLFDIIPLLNPGVIIHFHDICYPFEYPKEWILEGRFWNEAYLLKSFLMYNNCFEILLFNNYLSTHHNEWLTENLFHAKGPGGSIW